MLHEAYQPLSHCPDAGKPRGPANDWVCWDWGNTLGGCTPHGALQTLSRAGPRNLPGTLVAGAQVKSTDLAPAAPLSLPWPPPPPAPAPSCSTPLPEKARRPLLEEACPPAWEELGTPAVVPLPGKPFSALPTHTCLPAGWELLPRQRWCPGQELKEAGQRHPSPCRAPVPSSVPRVGLSGRPLTSCAGHPGQSCA